MFFSSLYFYPLVAAIIAFVFMYLDSKIFDTEKPKSTYFKNMFLVGFVVWLIVFMLDLDSTTELPFSQEEIKFIPEIGQRMLSGQPDF